MTNIRNKRVHPKVSLSESKASLAVNFASYEPTSEWFQGSYIVSAALEKCVIRLWVFAENPMNVSFHQLSQIASLIVCNKGCHCLRSYTWNLGQHVTVSCCCGPGCLSNFINSSPNFWHANPGTSPQRNWAPYNTHCHMWNYLTDGFQRLLTH